jgi:hypothetical protein
MLSKAKLFVSGLDVADVRRMYYLAGESSESKTDNDNDDVDGDARDERRAEHTLSNKKQHRDIGSAAIGKLQAENMELRQKLKIAETVSARMDNIASPFHHALLRESSENIELRDQLKSLQALNDQCNNMVYDLQQELFWQRSFTNSEDTDMDASGVETFF